MSVLLLTFDLNQKDAGAIEEIERKLSTFDSTMQIAENSWLIETDLSSGVVFSSMSEYFDSDDSVFVFSITGEWEAAASFDQHTWLENHLP